MTDIVSRQAAPAVAPVAQVRDQMQLQMDMAAELSRADMLPKAFRGKPANVLIAISMAAALGIEPAIALYGMHVIEGRPTPSAELQASLVRRAGHKLRVVEHTNESATVVIIRYDDPDHEFDATYTAADARDAGALDHVARYWPSSGPPKDWAFPASLDHTTATADQMIEAGCPPVIANGDWKVRDSPWHKRLRLMLFHRAVTECVTIACPEIRSGLAMDFGQVETPVGAVAEHVTRDVVEILAPSNPVVEVEPEAVSLGETQAPAPPPEPVDDFIVDAEIVDDPEPVDTRTVEDISGDPRDAVFDTPPATTMPAPAAEPDEAKAFEPVDPATFKAMLNAKTKWNSIRLLNELANVGESNITIDQVCEDERLYSIATAIIQNDPT